MALTWWNEQHEFRHCGVQLKTVRAHPAGDLFDAAAKVTAEFERFQTANVAFNVTQSNRYCMVPFDRTCDFLLVFHRNYIYILYIPFLRY